MVFQFTTNKFSEKLFLVDIKTVTFSVTILVCYKFLLRFLFFLYYLELYANESA